MRSQSFTRLCTKLTFSSDQGYRSTAAEEILNPIRDTDPNLANPDSFGIHFRTLGDLGYFITSLNTERQVIAKVEKRILEVLGGPGQT